ncbi:potassium channel family protein, partial [Rhizobium ruizarguesonis]
IPQAMWWAVVTLSTTGYGDEIPQSLAGRVLAGLVMMIGIGIFALWAGILATGFYEDVRRQASGTGVRQRPIASCERSLGG